MIAKKTPAVKTEVKKAEPKAVEKATENSVETVAQKTANTVTKSVVVPRCNDSKVFAVLSDAFKKQGAATNTQMTVKQITKARETQSYPQQGIRSCNAIVETNSVKYVTDYSIILNDKGFFVHVEPDRRGRVRQVDARGLVASGMHGRVQRRMQWVEPHAQPERV